MKFNVPINPKLKYTDNKKTKVLSLRLTEAMLRRLKVDSVDKNRSVSEIIELILDQYLQQQD